MQLTTIVSALLLPLLAVADGAADASSTTTCTSTQTMYKTVTIQRVVATATMTYGNSTATSGPTGAGPTKITTGPTTAATVTPNGGVTLGSAHVAVAGFAGMLVAALM